MFVETVAIAIPVVAQIVFIEVVTIVQVVLLMAEKTPPKPVPLTNNSLLENVYLMSVTNLFVVVAPTGILPFGVKTVPLKK